MSRAAPFLAIDTSTPLGSAALGRGEDLLGEVMVGIRAKHAETLLPAIDALLRSSGVRRQDLGGIVVAGGPGSFTGLRIAGATAKGLVRALGLPLFAYSALSSLAAGAGRSGSPVYALFDAKRGEVYAACFRFPGFMRPEMLLEPTPLQLDELLSGDAPAPPRGALFVGDGALRNRQAIEAVGGTVAPAFMAVPRAAALLWLADLAPDEGRVDDIVGWEPDYLRPSGAERGRPAAD